MNIQNWGLGQIMQLPDCCFGRRWPLGLGGSGSNAVPSYDISEEALPDVCVLWEIFAVTSSVTAEFGIIELRLGDHLPADRAEFQEFEMLVPGLVDAVQRRSRMMVAFGGNLYLNKLRMPVAAQGRRVVVEFSSRAIDVVAGTVGLTFSSIPREVPDWLVSANLRSP